MRLLGEIFLVSSIVSMLILAGILASSITLYEEFESVFRKTKREI